MASFVESAVLKVIDESTGPLAKINAELKKLASAGKALKGLGGNLDIKTANLSKAAVEIRKIETELRKLKSLGAVTLTPRVDLGAATAGLNRLTQQMRQMQRMQIAPQFRAPGITQRALGTAAGIGAYSAGSHLAAATKTGTRDVDIGDTALAIRQLGAERRSFADQMINQILKEQEAPGRPGGQIFNRGQIAQLFAESLGVVREGASQALKTPEARTAASQEAMRAAKFLTDQTSETARMLIALGKSEDDARESAINYSKALEAQDVLTDTSGKFNQKKAQEWFDFQRQLIPVVGKEMTGEFYRQQVKYLRSARFPMSKEAIAVTMFAGEEMGTSAAVGMSQMIKQMVTTASTKAARKEQVAFGLRPDITAPPPEQKKARENPLQYLIEDMIPKLRKKGYAEFIDKATGEKIDPLSDPTVVGTLADKIFSERTAKEAFVNLMLRRNEYLSQLQDLASRRGDIPTVRDTTKDSVQTMMTGLSNQFQGVLGEGIKTLAPLMQEVITPLTGYLTDTQKEIARRRAAKEPIITPTELALGAIGGIAIKSLVGDVSGLIGRTLSTVTTPLGYTAGLQGMMAPNEATRTLSAAGISLLAAAGELSAAAGKLGGGLPGLVRPPGVGPGGVGPGVTGAGGAAGSATLIQILRRYGLNFLKGAGIGAAVGIVLDSDPAGGASNLDKLERIKKANQGLNEYSLQLAEAEDRLKLARDPADIVKYTNDVSALKLAIAQVRQELGVAREELFAKPPTKALTDLFGEPVPPSRPTVQDLNRRRAERFRPTFPLEKPAWVDQFILKLQQPPPAPKFPDLDADAIAAKLKSAIQLPDLGADEIAAKLKAIQLPELPRPSWLDELLKPATPLPRPSWLDDMLKPVLPTPPLTGGIATDAATVFATSIGGLGTAASQFETAFGTGTANVNSAAANLGAAGSIAADTLYGAAGGIGAAIGGAAVGVLQGASINVNVNVGGAVPSRGNPGPQTNTPGSGG